MTTLVAALGALGSQALPAGAASVPPEGNIVAQLSEPLTIYLAAVSDPDGDELSFDWSDTVVSCGTFTPNP
ncbi:MAG: hypothetical protein ACRDK3_10285, partial [Actinomycetota bacterium]